MTLRRQWIASCDEPGCEETWVYPHSSHDRWDVGIALNDAGWQAGPGKPETYCPKHRKDGDFDQRIAELLGKTDTTENR